jgi:hypothetical protein
MKGKNMAKIVKDWLYGWVVLFRFWLFSLIAGLILLPVQILIYYCEKKENTLFWIFHMLAFLILVPFAFWAASRITGYFAEKDSPLVTGQQKFIDPNTGVVTEINHTG